MLWREATFHLLVEQFMNETLAKSVAAAAAVVCVFVFAFYYYAEGREDREGYRDIGYSRQRHLFCV